MKKPNKDKRESVVDLSILPKVSIKKLLKEVLGRKEVKWLRKGLCIPKSMLELEYVAEPKYTIYLAQPMANIKTQSTWLRRLSNEATNGVTSVSHSIRVIDPWVWKAFSDNPQAIVTWDRAMVELCDILIIDLTRGWSVGASIEMSWAYESGREVWAVTNNPEKLGAFVHVHADLILHSTEVLDQIHRIMNESVLVTDPASKLIQ